jgi:hypothetical protein
MTLPAAVKSHHTAWVTAPGTPPRAVRYAVEGERLVCFGDDGLASVPDGSRVSVAVHEIAGGQMLATFPATVRRLAPDAIDTNALVELLEHVSLGRTLAEVEARLDVQRRQRRVLELVS